jgi:transposase
MGRMSSPNQQGREQDRMYIGIDVSKDRLDVHVRPAGEAFSVTRDETGLAELVTRLGAVGPALIVLEATGGFETIVATTLAAAGLPLAVVNPRQIRAFAQACGQLAKLMRSMRRSSRASPKPCGRSHAPFRITQRARWANCWRGGARSSA